MLGQVHAGALGGTVTVFNGLDAEIPTARRTEARHGAALESRRSGGHGRCYPDGVEFDLVLRTVADRLDADRIRFAVIGGLAVHAWGRARPTRDADFVVDLAKQSSVLQLTESLGYRTRYVSDAFSNHDHDDARMGHVDFMYVSGPTAEAIFAAASPKALLEDRALPVASPEHLAMMKAAAMKNFPHRALYEADDVRILLAVPGVDREAVREYFSRQGLLELFDAIEQTR